MDLILKIKKLRLYIALYALEGVLREPNSSGPQDYHWAFIIAPKDAPTEKSGIRYRIKKSAEWEKLNPGSVEFGKVEWETDRSLVPLGRHDDIIARVLIAEIEDAKAVDEHIQLAWPEKTMHVKGSGEPRTSRDWAQRVLEGLGGPSPNSLSGTVNLVAGKLADWKTIESCCRVFANKVVVENAGLNTVPTFDML